MEDLAHEALTDASVNEGSLNSFGGPGFFIYSVDGTSYKKGCGLKVGDVSDVVRMPLEDRGRVVFITRDLNRLNAKLLELRSASAEERVMLIDWDRTITRSMLPDGRTPVRSSYGVLEKYFRINANAQRLMHARHEYYYAVELDALRCETQKARMMLEWSRQNNQTLIDEGKFTLERIREALDDAKWTNGEGLRDGALEFIFAIEGEVVIFSAGIRDVIDIFLTDKGKGKRVRVFGNKMIFDAEGIHCGFEEPILIPSNKCNHPEAINNWNERKESVVAVAIGDSVHDVGMLTPVVNRRETLSVGILSDQILSSDVDSRGDEHRRSVELQRYLDAFDVVMLGDRGFKPISRFLKLN